RDFHVTGVQTCALPISTGGEFTPDPLSDNYLKRITYRAGIHYENAPFLINNNQLRDFGINFGFSMPAGRSSLDFAFSTGKRGDRSEERRVGQECRLWMS